MRLFGQWHLLSADHDSLSMMPRGATLFLVRRAGCERALLTVDRIRDAEIAAFKDHLRVHAPSEGLGDTPPVAEIMRRLRVTPVDYLDGNDRTSVPGRNGKR